MLLVFFFNDSPTTEIYTLSLHDALPILDALRERVRTSTAKPQPTEPAGPSAAPASPGQAAEPSEPAQASGSLDRKSTRLNSSHANISYAVFCLKKKMPDRTESNTMDLHQ